MGSVSKYFSLVRFAHTIFAMPFALAGYVYAMTANGIPFDWIVLLKMLLCMVFARNTAMGFNRWADRRIDAENPRTAGREIPSGKISAGAAFAFVVVNASLFILTAALLNTLALILAPVALFVLLSYSYTKRFTAWCHLVLGISLGMAPVAAYIAVAGGEPTALVGAAGVVPVLLAGLVASWVTGFDILYALQDMEFDRANGLHSVPARWGAKRAVRISVALHAFSTLAVILIGVFLWAGWVYWLGTGIFAFLLVVEHALHTATPSGILRIARSFGLVNGLAGFCYAGGLIAWLLIS